MDASSLLPPLLAALCAPASTSVEEQERLGYALNSLIDRSSSGSQTEELLGQQLARAVAAHSIELVSSLQALRVLENPAHHRILVNCAQLLVHSMRWCGSRSSSDMLLRIGAVAGALLAASRTVFTRLASATSDHEACTSHRKPEACLLCWVEDNSAALIAMCAKQLFLLLVERKGDRAIAALRRTCCRPDVVLGWQRALVALVNAFEQKIAADGIQDIAHKGYANTSAYAASAISCTHDSTFAAEQQAFTDDVALQRALARFLLSCKRRLAAEPRPGSSDWPAAWESVCTNGNRNWSCTGGKHVIQAASTGELEALISAMLGPLAVCRAADQDALPVEDRAALIAATCGDAMYMCEVGLALGQEPAQRPRLLAALEDACLRAVAAACEALAALTSEQPDLARGRGPADDGASAMACWACSSTARAVSRLQVVLSSGDTWLRTPLACSAAEAAVRLAVRLIVHKATLLGAAALTLGAAAQALAPICGRQPEQQECAERELLAGLAVVAGQEMGNMEEGALRIAEGLAELRCANLTCPHLPGQRGRLCSGCKLVRFCCPECSKQAWPTHKLACRLLAARRAEAAA
eukprot:scaffold1.g5508.t1